MHGHTGKVALETLETLVLARLLRAPGVLTEHWGLPLTGKLSTRQVRAMRFALPRVSAVVAVSNTMAASLARQGFARRCIVVPNGVDLDAVMQAGRRRRPRSAQEPLRLVAVGSLLEDKGHRDLLNAVSGLQAERFDARLTIFGEGEDRPCLERLVRRLGLGQKVVLRGERRRDEVFAELATSDIYVLPSWSETFSVATLEALAMGTPAVLTRCGGPEDFMFDDSCIMVEPGNPRAMTDGIASMAHDLEARRAAAIRNAAAIRAEYSPAVICQRLAALYDSLYENSAQRRRRQPGRR